MTVQLSAPLLVSYLALWALVVVQGMILLGLVRVVYRALQSGSAPAPPGEQLRSGQPVPEFSATDLAGRAVGSAYFAGGPGALLFISPNCEACALTLAEMEALSQKAGGRLLVICRGGRTDCRALAEQHEISIPVVPDERYEISDLFAISSVPMAVLITAANTIQSYGRPQRNDDSVEMPQAAAEVGRA